MDMLQLNLLGKPEVIFNGSPVTGFETAKTQALLYFLAVTGRAHSRETLADLLWGEMPEARAKRNLTKALSNLPAVVKPYLLVDRQTIAFDQEAPHALDVVIFQAAVTGSVLLHPVEPETELAPLRQAVSLYRGDFLEGFYVKDALPFEEWMLGQREQLRELVLQGLDHLVEVYTQPGHAGYTTGLEYAARLLALDPWRESAHRQMMILLARTGQRSAALAQYETCRQVLAEELGVEPSPETTGLYNRLKVLGTSPPHNLPPSSNTFVGREAELNQLALYLDNPGYRLVTLLGPGGIGKTRLAIRAARNYLQRETLPDGASFSDGVFIVYLASVQGAPADAGSTGLALAIAAALNISLHGSTDPVLQLVNYLRRREILLILDNFEHLVESAGTLVQLLHNAPQLKLLVTSRERLNLQEEWVLNVPGLSYPSTTGAAGKPCNLEDYGAPALFLQRARQIQADFSLVGVEQHVIRICQLVEGVPLAIELAASWLRVLSCADIAAELEEPLDFLIAPVRNLPERHRSIRTVFEQSWQMLSGQEQMIFRRLSIFRGGFRREAAQEVAGASLPVLASLADKSLLRLTAAGRYEIHELLRQFAAEQAVQRLDDMALVYDRHCAYYANFLHQRQAAMAGSRQLEATAEIEADLENIQAAWEWAVTQARAEELYRASSVLSLFHQFKSRYRERADALESAIARLLEGELTEQKERTLALLWVEQGYFYLRFGQIEKARQVFEQSRAIYDRLQIVPPRVYGRDPLIGLGMLASTTGDYRQASTFGEMARRRSEAYQHQGNLMVSVYMLAEAALAQGDIQVAGRYARQALSVAEEIGDRWFRAYCLNILGHIAVAEGHYAEAEQRYQASYAMREMFKDLEGMALALNHLGKIAMLQQDDDKAQDLYRQGLAIYEEINDRGGLAASLEGLGAVAGIRGDHGAARQLLRRALRIAADIPFVPLVLSILTSIAELMYRAGRPEQALATILFVLHHPAGNRDIKSRASLLLASLEGSGLARENFTAARERSQSRSIETVVDEVFHLLGEPESVLR